MRSSQSGNPVVARAREAAGAASSARRGPGSRSCTPRYRERRRRKRYSLWGDMASLRIAVWTGSGGLLVQRWSRVEAILAVGTLWWKAPATVPVLHYGQIEHRSATATSLRCRPVAFRSRNRVVCGGVLLHSTTLCIPCLRSCCVNSDVIEP